MTDKILNPSQNMDSVSKEQIISATQEISRIIHPEAVVSGIGFHHPNISPVALGFGNIEIRWYSLAYLFGIILGWLYIRYISKKYDNSYLKGEVLESLNLWVVFGIVLGGRLGYVLFYNLEYYLNNIHDILQIWKGGMSFHGGLTGVIVALYLFSKFHKLDFLKITDLAAVATPIGLFLGRIANFINMELIGKPTSVAWGVIYPHEDIARHPSQLYEALLEGLVLFLILYILIRFFDGIRKKGLLSAVFMISYGVFRMFIEHFREPDPQLGYIIENISMGQILCLPMILIGLVILLPNKSFKR